jgi:arsenate reductase
MAEVTIYHNPRCTKSRQAMEVLDELGVDATVVRYLDAPPDAGTLRELIGRLEDEPAALVRRDGWTELGITDDDVATADGVVEVLVRHPQLMQRPVLDDGERAIIGRPTERVRDLLA